MKIVNPLIGKFKSFYQSFLDKFFDVMPWVSLYATALSTPLAYNAIKKLVEKNGFGIGIALTGTELYLNVAYILFSVTLMIVLYRLRQHLFKARTQGIQIVERREHLILFLSNFNERQLKNYTDQLIPKELDLKNTGLQSLETDLSLIEEHKKNNAPWPWEMTLRAIRHHIGSIESPTLKTITVICSPESIKQFPHFKAIVENYLINTKITLKLLAKKNAAHCWETCNDGQTNQILNGYNFEDFDELTSALHWYIKQQRKNKVREKEIMIDFTGGMKVTSVVAATLTFNSSIKAQYISTITSQVKGYDVIYGTSDLPSIN